LRIEELQLIQGTEPGTSAAANHSLSMHRVPVARELAPAGPVGAAERSEAAIFLKTLEFRAKDQKIAGFASSYRAEREQAPSPQVLSGMA
jgi:hypothetical protein